jgi:hypothetical protein
MVRKLKLISILYEKFENNFNVCSKLIVFVSFDVGLTPAKFPKSLTEKPGGFDSISASNSTIGHQDSDAFRHIDRPHTPSQGQLSSPFLPGGYQRRILSSRMQSPIIRNSSYLDQGNKKLF